MTNCEQHITDSTYSRIPNITNSHHRVTISQTHDNIRFTMTSETDSITCSNHILTSRTHYIPLMTSDSQWHQRLTMSHTHNVTYSHHINHRLTITSQTHQTQDNCRFTMTLETDNITYSHSIWQIHQNTTDAHHWLTDITDSQYHRLMTTRDSQWHHRLNITYSL